MTRIMKPETPEDWLEYFEDYMGQLSDDDRKGMLRMLDMVQRRAVEKALGVERELASGHLSKNTRFLLIVTGHIGSKEIDNLIRKLEIDRDVLMVASEKQTQPVYEQFTEWSSPEDEKNFKDF